MFKHVHEGFNLELVLLVITLLLMVVNMSRGESNVMKGVLHLALFSGYVIFVFI